LSIFSAGGLAEGGGGGLGEGGGGGGGGGLDGGGEGRSSPEASVSYLSILGDAAPHDSTKSMLRRRSSEGDYGIGLTGGDLTRQGDLTVCC